VPLIWLQPDGPGFLGGFVAAGAASSRLPHRIAPAVAGTALVTLAFAAVVGAHRPVMTVMVSELGVLAFYRVGRFAVRLRERTEQAENLLVELEQTREAQLRAATLAERQRLAREMHDVLAHSLSGLVVHLEGGAAASEPRRADPTLADTVERAHHLAQAGLGEARQAIGMLRDEDLPGPERLPDLARQFEADTADTGSGDRGYGVSGMRERAELLGGTLTAQPTGTGFRVALFLPAGRDRRHERSDPGAAGRRPALRAGARGYLTKDAGPRTSTPRSGR
jgi:signal transduction histidine kinase